MKKEEIEVVISSYLKEAKNISYKFSIDEFGKQNYIQQFVDNINNLVNSKPVIEYKINNFYEFLDKLLEIKNRIDELKESDVND